jgi:hypothetical protein
MAGKMQTVRDDVAVTAVSEQQLQERAYHIWQSAGEPDGHDVEHWTQALRELLLEKNANATTTAIERVGTSVSAPVTV